MKNSWLIPMVLVLVAGMSMVRPEIAKADWTYTVRRGDTIFNISQRVGVSTNEIKRRNGIWSNALRIGQRITIPTGVAATPTRTSGDLSLLAHVVHAEAGAEPYTGKVAVGAVILNRIQNPKFPKTIAGVVYQPHAFESVSNGIINRAPSTESTRAAADALSGWDPSGGALYFFNPAKTNNPWIWARRIITQIGKHVFAI